MTSLNEAFQGHFSLALRREDNLSTRNKMAGSPYVFLIQRFYVP